MNPPTAIIAEDEPVLRIELADALVELWPELQIVAQVATGVEAIRALGKFDPQILFLDIEMPGMSGLDVARVASGKCHVVFVTAYDEYAVAAFDQGALDYVTKPFTRARLAKAIARIRERMKSVPADLDDLLRTLAAKQRPLQTFLRWISVHEGRNLRLVTVDEICYFQADNKYTAVVTATGQSLIEKTIKELAAELDPETFIQIHRATIVNVNAIATVHRNLRGRYQVRLKDRTEALQVSASFVHAFRDM